MKALVSVEIGGPETLRFMDIPNPVPGEGQLVVRMRACSLNFPDLLMIEDRYQTKAQRPFVPGMEIAGTVAAIGPGVEGFAVGDRVASATEGGGLAEYVVTTARDTLLLPDELGFAEGSALVICHGTAIYGLEGVGRLQPGETLLITGASGGLGRAAVELGRAMGAKVIAAVSSEAKGEIVRAAGADHVVVYPHAPLDDAAAKLLTRQFKDAAGPKGVDVVFDIVGGDYSEPALRAIAPGGRFLVVGFTAGIGRIPLNLPLLKECQIVGVYWGNFRTREPDADRLLQHKLLQFVREGRISPLISETYPLERGQESFASFANRTVVGKVVVTSGGEGQAFA